MQKPRQFREVYLKWAPPNSILVEDIETHDTYQYFRVDLHKYQKNKGALCSSLCGHQLKRFHFSCLFCRLRRVAFGKLPPLLQITPYILVIRTDSQAVNVRFPIIRFLAKNLQSLVETLYSW
jgi:hypothetical protein